MDESKIIMTIDSCPRCHSREKVVYKGFELAEVEIPTDAFPSVRKVFTPLQNPNEVTGTMKGILTHYDVCIRCGTEYCTRAEYIKVAAQPSPMMSRMPPLGRGL